MNPYDIHVQSDHFDGPLGLLLALIQKEDLSLKDLDISKITHQYLGYVNRMREINFDLAGDYLFMAATLLFLKSKNCLSDEESESLLIDQGVNQTGITTKAELIRRLEELDRFQRLGEKLWALPKKGHEIFTKPRINKKAIVDSILTPVELEKIVDAMLDLISKENRKYKVVKRDRLSIKEKLQYLREYLQEGDKKNFSELLFKSEETELDDKIITFISLLELARLKKITLFQNQAYSEILIQVVDTLKNFDVESADGFEPEDAPPAEALEAPTTTIQ